MPRQKFVALFVSESSDGHSRQESVQFAASHNGGPAPAERKAGVVFRGQEVTLKELMRGLACEDGVVRAPLEVSGCKIVCEGDETLDLSYVVFRRGFSVTDSEFCCKVNLSFAVFEHSADFTGTKFFEEADFRAARAKCDFRVTLARFDKYACFDDLSVGETFRAEGASFAEVDFNRASLAKNALFCSALVEVGPEDCRMVRTRFRGKADFTDAHIGGSAYFKGARFRQRAIFDRLRVDGAAFFDCDLYQDAEDERADNLQFRRQKIKPPAGPPEVNRLPLRVALFAGKVSFVGARFGHSVSFSGAQFKGVADFRRARIEGTALFDHFRTVIEGRAVLIPVCFGGNALFQMLDVRGEAQFHAAQFRGQANFERAQVGGRAYFTGVSFGGRVLTARFHGEARFLEAHFGGTAGFFGAVFDGPANFQHFNTDVSVLFRTAEYQEKADFSLRPDAAGLPPAPAPLVPLARALREAPAPVVFKAEAHFLALRTRGNAEFDGAHFKRDASFERAVVGGSLRFRPEYFDTAPVRFHGVANFMAAVVEGSAHFSGTYFQRKAEFRAALFKGNAYFDDTLHAPPKSSPEGDVRAERIRSGSVKFMGPVLFAGARFLNEGDFTGTVFDEDADFTNVVVEGTASFRGASFHGRTVFRGATFNVLTFGLPAKEGEGEAAPQEGVATAALEGAATGPAAANGGGAGGHAPGSPAHTRPAAFTHRATIDLRGLTYQQVEVDLDTLLKKLRDNGDIRFERQPYTQLEKAFSAVGDDHRAGTIYHELRWRELAEKKEEVARKGRALFKDLWGPAALKGFSGHAKRVWGYPKRVWQCRKRVWQELVRLSGLVFDYVFLGGLARFGVRPVRLFVISLLLLSFGAFLFSRRDAVTQRAGPLSPGQTAPRQQPASACEGTKGCTVTEAFGVSLNQFIPIVEIPSGSRWKPSETPIPVPLFDDKCYFDPTYAGTGWCKFDYFSYAFYGTIHRLFGAILVPLGLAALTGLLHRREKASGKG